MSEDIGAKSSTCFFRLTIDNADTDITYEMYIDIGSDYDDGIWSKIGTIADEYEANNDSCLVRNIKYMGYIMKANQ